MKIDSDDFEIFGIERRQTQDRAQLDARWRTLQAEVHPDRHASGGASAQRAAMQWATRVNEAYQRLKDPLRRAGYLCELNAAPIEAEINTSMPTGFLIQQLEWREALDDAGSVVEVEALAEEVAAHRARALDELQQTLDGRRDFKSGAEQVRALMFVERFAHDVDRRLEALGQ
jgi:molecular chaperone HscB